jgi:ketosteroid isomerase-like protein
MSGENVEAVREGIDAFNRRDLDAFVALLAPRCCLGGEPRASGLREVYRGRAEVRRWIEEVLEAVEIIHNEVGGITDLRDDRVFTENVLTGRGRGSGVPVELRYWAVLWVAEGKLARRQVFWNREDALKAAGLSE